MGARAGVHRAGSLLLAELLNQHDIPATSPCSCGQQARYYDRRERQLLTALGEVKFERVYYVVRTAAKAKRRMTANSTSRASLTRPA